MPSLATSLPADWYHREDVFSRERERIFRKHWSFVAPVDLVDEPGRFATTEIGGVPVVVCRDRDRTLRGFINLCRHRASPLCPADTGRITRFVCPYHAWCYALDGTLLKAPGFGPELDMKQHGLIPVRVEKWNHLIFACLDMEGPRLENWLGDIVRIARDYPAVEQMEFETICRNRCPANWKNYSDNSAEGYHLSCVHKELDRSLVTGNTRIRAHEHGQFVGFEVTYRDGNAPGYWIYKFPGLLMHFSRNSINLEVIRPQTPASTEMHRWFWFLPEVTKRDRQETIAFSSRVMEEDIGICARVQKNLESGYHETGILSEEREPGTIFFQSCVRNALS